MSWPGCRGRGRDQASTRIDLWCVGAKIYKRPIRPLATVNRLATACPRGHAGLVWFIRQPNVVTIHDRLRRCRHRLDWRRLRLIRSWRNDGSARIANERGLRRRATYRRLCSCRQSGLGGLNKAGTTILRRNADRVANRRGRMRQTGSLTQSHRRLTWCCRLSL
jgi:hypothetical protein